MYGHFARPKNRGRNNKMVVKWGSIVQQTLGTGLTTTQEQFSKRQGVWRILNLKVILLFKFYSKTFFNCFVGIWSKSHLHWYSTAENSWASRESVLVYCKWRMCANNVLPKLNVMTEVTVNRGITTWNNFYWLVLGCL